MNAEDVRSRVLAWYRAHRRDLPWRRTRDPYSVWISEIMLQQTRVDTVIPYFERFLSRWPTVESLAAADPDDVRAAWSGLGYYRRAKLMLEAAHQIVRDREGRFPASFDELESLPGLGRYTAGAVASIAYDTSVPAVDGNVLRVLARFGGVEGDVTRGEPNRSIWSLAEELASGASAGDLNQGLIEIGALVCSPKNPSCGRCPLAEDCRARADGSVDRIPPPKKRPARSTIEVTALLCIEGDSVLLERQPREGLFADLWCLPMLEGRLEPDAVEDEAKRKYGWELDSLEPIAELKHVLTHRDILMRVVRVGGEIQMQDGMRRTRLNRLRELGIPTATMRALRAAAQPPLL